MLTPPEDLSEPALVRVLADSWKLHVGSLEYRAVGLGSHHGHVVDTQGVSWFVTVDDLDSKQLAASDTVDAAFARLGAALATAQDLGNAGCAFAVAPVATVADTPLVQLDHRFAVALYPFVEGTSYAWGDFSTHAHRLAPLDRIVALHSVPITATPHAAVDDFAVPLRDQLESGLEPGDPTWDRGPYARLTSTLLIDHAQGIRQALAEYDGLVQTVRGRAPADRVVVTHGEPHPGNTILREDRWLLIDWDTVLIAPPERDLWNLDTGDGSAFAAYTGVTGTALLPPALALYRARWDLSELAVYVDHFRRHHTGSGDDEKSWNELSAVVDRLRA